MRLVRGCGFIIILMFTLFAALSHAAVMKPLRPDQAFQFSYEVTAPSTVVAKWKIARGYYLYRDRFAFITEPAVNVDINYPATNITSEKNIGKHTGYAGELAIPVTVTDNAGAVTLRINYQGCSTAGFCYPPMTKTVVLNTSLNQAENNAGFAGLMNDQQKVSQMLSVTPQTSLLLLMFVGLGLLLSFTPCVLPMIPILTSIIVGQRGAVSTRKALLLSVSYVLGAALTYAVAGVAAAMMGSSLQVWLQQPAFIYAGALIFILLALSLFGVFEFHMPAIMRNMIVNASNQQRGGAYAGVFLMGVLSALLVSPCVTAPLVGVLMYVASTGNIVLGASALFAIGIGMGIPLIAVGVSAGKWLPKRGPWMDAVSKFFGLMMLAMAIWLLSRVVSFSLTAVLYGALLLLGGLVIAVFLPRHIGWRRLNYSLGMLSALTGVVFIVMAFQSGNLTGYVHHSSDNATTPFVVVHNEQALNRALEVARDQKKPVLIDFYADWCASCVEMENEVFDKAPVLTQLQNFMLIRVDITENNADDQALLARYNVLAPPTVLLINQRGDEDGKLRIIGEMSANAFISRVQVFAQTHCENKTIC